MVDSVTPHADKILFLGLIREQAVQQAHSDRLASHPRPNPRPSGLQEDAMAAQAFCELLGEAHPADKAMVLEWWQDARLVYKREYSDTRYGVGDSRPIHLPTRSTGSR